MRCYTPSSSCRRKSPSARLTRVTRAGAPGSATTSSHDVPDYDPLTISDEELNQLPPAERGAVYKARRAAATGGAPPPAPATAPAAQPAAPAAAAPPAAAPSTGTTPPGGSVSSPPGG